MEGVLILGFLITFFGGIAGLIRPRWVRLPSRWEAVALLWFSTVVMGASIEFYPASGQEPADGAFVEFLITWLLFCGALWLLRRALLKRRAGDAAPPKRSVPLSWPPKEAPAIVTSEKHRAMLPSAEKIAARRRLGRAMQSKISGVPSHEPVQQSFEERTRLGAGPTIRHAPPGHVLAFEYGDEYGEVTDRRISSWTEHPRHIVGWCEDRNAERMFRKDRVLQWHYGQDELKRRR